MYFELSIQIDRSPDEVFAFLRDKDKYPQKDGSPVLLLAQTTSGLAGVGTRYREVVRMLPFVRGEILSVITRFEPGRYLEEDFYGAGMSGHLAYEFVVENGGTRLIQRETLQALGWLRLLTPLIRFMLGRQLARRLEDIRRELDAGRPA